MGWQCSCLETFLVKQEAAPHFCMDGCGSPQAFLSSGISLLWRKVLEAQESENIFLRSCMENSLLLRIKQPMAVKPQPLLLTAEPP